MSDGKEKYIPPKQWDRVKSKQVTPEYVHNFLHHEGLKCLTDGFTYYLDPEDKSRQHAFPDLRFAPEDFLGRLIEIEISRTQEVDPGVKRSPILTEYIAGKSLRNCQYWEFFLQKVNENHYIPSAVDFYLQEKEITIDWYEGPKMAEGEEEVEPIKESSAFNLRSVDQLGIESPPEIEILNRVNVLQASIDDIDMRYEEVVPYFHISKNFEKVFDDNHTFLLIGDKTFLCTNLIFHLGDSRKNEEFLDVENNLGILK